MKNTVFRRDEIWFAALNEKHSNELYSLYEIRREDNERVNCTAGCVRKQFDKIMKKFPKYDCLIFKFMVD